MAVTPDGELLAAAGDAERDDDEPVIQLFRPLTDRQAGQLRGHTGLAVYDLSFSDRRQAAGVGRPRRHGPRVGRGRAAGAGRVPPGEGPAADRPRPVGPGRSAGSASPRTGCRSSAAGRTGRSACGASPGRRRTWSSWTSGPRSRRPPSVRTGPPWPWPSGGPGRSRCGTSASGGPEAGAAPCAGSTARRSPWPSTGTGRWWPPRRPTGRTPGGPGRTTGRSASLSGPALAVAARGDDMVVATDDGRLVWLDVPTGRTRYSLAQATARTHLVMFSPDGRKLVTASGAGPAGVGRGRRASCCSCRSWPTSPTG